MFETYNLRWPALWLSIAWLLVATVIYLSLAPIDMTVPGANSDKYGHVLAYTGLMFWFAQIYSQSRSRFVIAIALAVMGVSLEFAQGLTDYRSFEYADMAADVIGVGVGWLIAPPRTWNLLFVIERLGLTP